MKKTLFSVMTMLCVLIFSGCHLQHTFVDADCVSPKTCTECGATKGEALGHRWAAATCVTPKTCTVCGATEGEALGHLPHEKYCTRCGEYVPSNIPQDDLIEIKSKISSIINYLTSAVDDYADAVDYGTYADRGSLLELYAILSTGDMQEKVEQAKKESESAIVLCADWDNTQKAKEMLSTILENLNTVPLDEKSRSDNYALVCLYFSRAFQASAPEMQNLMTWYDQVIAEYGVNGS